MADGKIGSGRRTGHGRTQDTRGIRQKITDSVSEFFGSVPTGVDSKKGKLHTVDDATDELRQYKMKGKKK